jgi:hypothetical protein
MMPDSTHPTAKTRRIAGGTLIYLVGGVLLASSAVKFAHMPKVVNEFGSMGFEGSKLTLIATLEIFSAALLLVNTSRSLGLIMVSAYMGGAIATHLQHAQSPAAPAFVLALTWIGVWLRHPEAVWRTHPQEGFVGNRTTEAPEVLVLRPEGTNNRSTR